LNKCPDFVQFHPPRSDLLQNVVGEPLGMLSEQTIVAGNRIAMMTGHARNAAYRDLLRGMPTNALNLAPIKPGMIEGGILRLDEVVLAMIAEILLISRGILPILGKVFSLFDQKESAGGILAGD